MEFATISHPNGTSLWRRKCGSMQQVKFSSHSDLDSAPYLLYRATTNLTTIVIVMRCWRPPLIVSRVSSLGLSYFLCSVTWQKFKMWASIRLDWRWVFFWEFSTNSLKLFFSAGSWSCFHRLSWSDSAHEWIHFLEHNFLPHVNHARSRFYVWGLGSNDHSTLWWISQLYWKASWSFCSGSSSIYLHLCSADHDLCEYTILNWLCAIKVIDWVCVCEKFSRFSIQLILRLFSFHSSLTAKNLEIHLLCGYLAAVTCD